MQAARFPQPEIVAALDAQAVNLANTFASPLVDFALGWSVPFIEGLRRATKQPRHSGNLYGPGGRQ